MHSKPTKINTYINLNRNIYYWGLTGFQLIRIVVVSLLGFIITFLIFMAIFNGLTGITITAIITAGVLWPAKNKINKIQIENKKGNPNFSASIKINKYSPNYLLDRSNVMGLLNKEE